MNTLRTGFLVAVVGLGLATAPGAVESPALGWVWELPARKPAWEFTPRMPLDSVHVPVVQGRLVLVSCEHNGALLALDLHSGAEQWRFYTNGPLRTPPVADSQCIYVASDDGYLYCLDHGGRLRWKFRGGPSARKVIGHERLMSAWPASARPALADGRVYFVAGYWPIDGVFVHALDARSGSVVWTNSTAQYRPTGTLRVIGSTLFVDGHHGSGAYDLRSWDSRSSSRPPLLKIGSFISFKACGTPSFNSVGSSTSPGPRKAAMNRDRGEGGGGALGFGFLDGSLGGAISGTSRATHRASYSCSGVSTFGVIRAKIASPSGLSAVGRRERAARNRPSITSAAGRCAWRAAKPANCSRSTGVAGRRLRAGAVGADQQQ
jgi:hypothetical protein